LIGATHAGKAAEATLEEILKRAESGKPGRPSHQREDLAQ